MAKLANLTAAAKNLTSRARKWQAAGLTALIVVIALGLAAYAAAASYDTVSGQAAAHGVSLPRLNPLGIDGGLFGIILLDIALTWAGQPIWWLRLMARLFAVATIAANASAGWPSPVGTGLRIAAPALFVIIVEAGRTVLLRKKNAAERERRAADKKRRRDNRIPRIRWALDFRGTLAIWRRMRLWREPSYRVAVNMELDRLAAIEKLAMKFGGPELWREQAPANLVWMLEAGVRMPEALAMVAELTGPRQSALEVALGAEKEARAQAEAVIESLHGDLDSARGELAEAVARAEALARRRPAASGSGTRKRSGGNGGTSAAKPSGSGTRKPAAATAKASAPAKAEAPALGPDDLPGNWDELDTEARVLYLVNEKGLSGSAAGVTAGVTDGRGRQIVRMAKGLSETAPQDVVGETKEG